MPRRAGSSSSMISIARTLGAPVSVPAGKPAASASIARQPVAQLALHLGADVHDVAVPLDRELLGDLDGAELGDPAHIVAAEIEQHQVLGPLLRIGQQLPLQRLVLLGRRAPAAGAGERADGHHAVAQTHQDLRAGADDGEAAEIEEEQEGRRVDPPQRAVQRERAAARTAPRSVARARSGRRRRRAMYSFARLAPRP